MLDVVSDSASLQRDVLELILTIQRDEFGIDISAQDQPDLLEVARLEVASCYQVANRLQGLTTRSRPRESHRIPAVRLPRRESRRQC
jgi:hypothetical protein